MKGEGETALNIRNTLKEIMSIKRVRMILNPQNNRNKSNNDQSVGALSASFEGLEYRAMSVTN